MNILGGNLLKPNILTEFIEEKKKKPQQVVFGLPETKSRIDINLPTQSILKTDEIKSFDILGGNLLKEKRKEIDWYKLIEDTKMKMGTIGYLPEALDETLGITKVIKEKGLPKATFGFLVSTGEGLATAPFRFVKSTVGTVDSKFAEKIIPAETTHPTELILKAIGKEEWIKTSRPVHIGFSAQEQTKQYIEAGVDPKIAAMIVGSGAIFDAAITGGIAEGILRGVAGKPVLVGQKPAQSRKVLEVNKGATLKEIKVAYYKKAHLFHPDKVSGSASEFMKINQAYKTLTGVKPKTVLVKDIARELIKERHFFGKAAKDVVVPRPLLGEAKKVDPKFIKSFQDNLAPQVGRYSAKGQGIIEKLDFSKISNINQAVNLVEKSLPKELLKNPAIKQSITNWAKTTEMIVSQTIIPPIPKLKPVTPIVPKPPMPKVIPLAEAKPKEKPKYKKEEDITTKTLEKLKDKTVVSKQFISDLTNASDLKQTERDLFRKVLSEMPAGKINVKEFSDRIKTELLPLSTEPKIPPKLPGSTAWGHRAPMAKSMKWEDITLPDELRGSVADYFENIYESSIKTSGGKAHFDNFIYPNYFAHTRIEDLAREMGNIRRIIEIQSDLFQKGRLERETKRIGMKGEGLTKNELKRNSELSVKYIKRTITKEETKKWEELTQKRNLDKLRTKRMEEIKQLEPYRNTWHERIIREEIRRAAQDNKTKLQFPTGETAMKIEGLGASNVSWGIIKEGIPHPFEVNELKVGQEVGRSNLPISDRWIVTDVLGDGKFKAIQKSKEISSIKDYREVYGEKGSSTVEQFDISGKIDTSNPIYRFYERDVQKYLKRIKPDMKLITDKQGVKWYEVDVSKAEAKAPVEAYRKEKLGDLITIEKAHKELAKFFNKEEVEFIAKEGLIITKDGKVAYGKSVKQLIEIVKEKGMIRDKLLYHEAYHQYEQQFLTIKQISELDKLTISKLKEEGKTITVEEAQEIRADWFADYVSKKQTFTGRLLHFFRSLLFRIKKWMRMEDKVLKTFEDIIAKKRPAKAIVSERAPPKYKKKPTSKLPAEFEPLATEARKVESFKKFYYQENALRKIYKPIVDKVDDIKINFESTCVDCRGGAEFVDAQMDKAIEISKKSEWAKKIPEWKDRLKDYDTRLHLTDEYLIFEESGIENFYKLDITPKNIIPSIEDFYTQATKGVGEVKPTVKPDAFINIDDIESGIGEFNFRKIKSFPSDSIENIKGIAKTFDASKINPIIVTRGRYKWNVEDGNHRLAAIMLAAKQNNQEAKQLLKQIPVKFDKTTLQKINKLKKDIRNDSVDWLDNYIANFADSIDKIRFAKTITDITIKEKIPAELQLMSEQAKIQHLKDLASAIKSEGGIKTPKGMAEELFAIPTYLKNKNGFTPDELVEQLAGKGFFYEDGDALIEAIKSISGAKTIEAVETAKIQQRIIELKSSIVTKSKEFEVISDELKERIIPFFRPPRIRSSKAFSLLGNKDTTIPLFSEIFDSWTKNGVEIIVEPYAGAYTLGTHSIDKAIKSGLKEFHSNVFDKEKHIIIKNIQGGKINEVQELTVKTVKNFSENILKKAEQETSVSIVLKDFISKNPTSYIGSNKWVVYMRKLKVGKEVLIYKDVYEKYRKVFQDAMNEVASVKVVNLETAMLNSFYKKIGIFGGKGQTLLRTNGFVPFEDKIFGRFGMVQAFKDIDASFILAKKHNTKIKIYNEDGIEFVKNFDSVPEKTAFYFDPPYVKSSQVYKEVGSTQLERFNSGYSFYENHKNAFDMVKNGSRIALTNDVDQEYMSTILDKIEDSKIFAYKENNTPTSLISDTATGGTITDFIIEINEGRGTKAYKWANQKYLAEVIRRGGYTSKTIELLKRHNVPDSIIKELKVEGKYLKNLVKVKKEITGEVSTTISRKALGYIADTSKIKTVDKKWVKKISFETIKGDAIDVIQGYETGARFFFRIGDGFKSLIFDPIRAGERLAVKRAYRLRNIELKSVFKLNKKEAKRLWAYTADKQGREFFEGKLKTVEFKKLPPKVRRAYIDIRRVTSGLYPIVNRITIKRGREIGNVKNYSPLYTKSDIKVFDEGGFNFTRKDPFFGSIIKREKKVPADLYEQDYRKVMDAWVDGVSRYIDVGERTIGVKYLIDSKEFQEIAGKEVSKKIYDWYRYIVSPPKVVGTDKGLRVLRNLQAVSILGFKYTVPIKQFLNLFDFWTMLPAKRMMMSSLKAYGKSPTAKLATYSGSVQERSLGLAVQDLKNTLIVWGRKPAEYTDRLTARMGRIALLDQMIIRNKENGIKITPRELKSMERRADDIVDAVMGAMSKAETPAYFRSELGKNINMFYSQLNSKMQYYVVDIFKNAKYAKMSGSKAKLYAKALVAILVAGYIESTINKLYFVDDPEDMAKDAIMSIAGNFPIIGGLAFALETGMPYSPAPVLANITRLTMAIAKGQTEKALWTTAGFMGFPTQIKNLLTGGKVIEEGGVYDKNGRLLFEVKEFPEQIRTLLKGKWGSKKAQEYFEPKEEKEEIKEKLSPSEYKKKTKSEKLPSPSEWKKSN